MQRPWLILAVALLCVAPAHADAPRNITAGEIARLPDYCPDTQTFSARGSRDGPTDRQRHWVGLMGEPFWGMHHYCWALVGANRALAAGVTPQERRYLYASAIADSQFVVRMATREFPLLPEIYLRMGQFATAMGEPIQAMQYFDASRDVKPDYWPAYLELAQLHAGLGRRQAAVEVLQSGLQAMPDEPRLQQALSRLSRAPTSARPPAR